MIQICRFILYSFNIAPRAPKFATYSKVTPWIPEKPSDLTYDIHFKVKRRSNGQNFRNLPHFFVITAPRASHLAVKNKVAPWNSERLSDMTSDRLFKVKLRWNGQNFVNLLDISINVATRPCKLAVYRDVIQSTSKRPLYWTSDF